LPPTYYRGCWHVVSRGFFLGYRPFSSPRKGLYIPKDFVTHAASLHQGFPHCAISLIAAPQRSQGRVSVPVWLTILSDQLPVVALVSRDLTNKLIGRRPIPERIAPFSRKGMLPLATSGINPPFGGLSPSLGQVAYVLLNRLPLNKGPKSLAPLDLHTLGTPLAFVLSQDQTLHQKWIPREDPKISSREKGSDALPKAEAQSSAEPSRSQAISLSSHCSVFKDPPARQTQKTLACPRRPNGSNNSTRFPWNAEGGVSGSSAGMLPDTCWVVKGSQRFLLANPAGASPRSRGSQDPATSQIILLPTSQVKGF
jgi:hypothetical protein